MDWSVELENLIRELMRKANGSMDWRTNKNEGTPEVAFELVLRAIARGSVKFKINAARKVMKIRLYCSTLNITYMHMFWLISNVKYLELF